MTDHAKCPIAIDFAIPDDDGEIILHFPVCQSGKLSEDEKQKVLAELDSKLRPRNTLSSLSLTLDFLEMYSILPPPWVHRRMQALIRNLWEKDRRLQARVRQQLVDQVRWGVVRHLRRTQRLSWENAYAAASEALKETSSAGADVSMKASYQKHQRSAGIKRIVADDGADALDYWAQLAYDNRASDGRGWTVEERAHRVSLRQQSTIPG